MPVFNDIQPVNMIRKPANQTLRKRIDQAELQDRSLRQYFLDIAIWHTRGDDSDVTAVYFKHIHRKVCGFFLKRTQRLGKIMIKPANLGIRGVCHADHHRACQNAIIAEFVFLAECLLVLVSVVDVHRAACLACDGSQTDNDRQTEPLTELKCKLHIFQSFLAV
ncbi:hypothetical protein D3C71_1482320 [compost metagenome]